jgi:hypothetical protein
MAAFSTLLIGPDARGRDFRVRAEAQAPDATTPPGTQARNLPLALARWAETSEPDAVACLPLPGGDRIVLRARNHGRTESGFACFANAVIVPATLGHDPERVSLALLPLIPEPDGSDSFARAPLAVEQLRPLAAPDHDWTGLEPRWHRRQVVTDGTPAESVLASILARLPPEAHAPSLGWATSPHWASVIGDTGLIVVAPGRESQIPGYDQVRMTATGFDGQSYSPPLAIRIRDRFSGLLAPEVRSVAQAITGNAETIEDHVRSSAITAIGQMDYDNALSQILSFAAVPASECDGFFTKLSRQLFSWFVQADRFKGQLRRTLDIFEAPSHQPFLSVLGPVANHMLDSNTLCRDLDAAVTTRLIERHDLLAVLAARSDLPRVLATVRPDVAVMLYDGLLSRGMGAETAERLVASARDLFRRIDLGGMAAALNRHLTIPGSIIKTRLLIELVLLVYQADVPASRRHG